MCGIAVAVNGDVSKMGEAIKHRGIKHNVTDLGNIKVWFSYLPIVNQDAPIQPFQSGKWVVWLNGYISNYKELCFKYKIDLKVDCDTLFLAEFFAKFDLSRLSELNGFFSVVCYDQQNIHCFTDRYGIKQLYEYTDGETRYICSEAKGILAVVRPEIDPEAIVDWHYSLGIMTDHTIFKGIKRVDRLPFNKPKQIQINYNEARDHLKVLFDKSILRNKIKGDGCFLSGGVDSAMIAKAINPEYSFSVDYVDDGYSEIDNIKLNTTGKHYTIICNEHLFRKYKHKTLQALDDLKAGSCYTNFAVQELASKFCTVMYSGAGGDEVFRGYQHRYNKPINAVIKRTQAQGAQYNITHEEYDWRYLAGILVVEDRMSGYHTMETRYPLLDNDFVDFALSLPESYRDNKRILKDISGLPDKVVNGKKRGFSNPYIDNLEWTKHCMNEISRLFYGIRN